MEKKSNKKIWHNIHDFVMIALGCLIFAVTWKTFLIPNHIVGGGASGICAIVQLATGIPISLTYAAMNIVLLAIAVKVFGWAFCLKTIIGVACMTGWFAVPFEKLEILQDIIQMGNEDYFLATVLGGIFSGLGIGLIFASNGSSGGTDIIAKVVNKYRNITLGKAMMMCDVIIISSSYFLPENGIKQVMYGLMVMVIMTYVVDLVINGDRQSVQFFIFSKKYEEMADHIQNETHRGVTILDGMGWYTKQPSKVITVMARKNESTTIFRLIKEVDPDAFVSQSAAIGVYGKGFEEVGKK